MTARLTAAELVELVLDDHSAFCRRLGQALKHELVGLLARDPAERSAARTARYRRLGLPR